MAKDVNDIVLDQAMNYIKTNGTRVYMTSGECLTYASCGHASALVASLTASAGNYVGPSAGSASGRRIGLSTTTGSIAATGNASWVAICDGSLLSMLAHTTLTSQACTIGNPVVIGNTPIYYEIPDPT